MRSSWLQRALVRTYDVSFGSGMAGITGGGAAMLTAMAMQNATSPSALQTAFSDAFAGAGIVGVGIGLASGPVQRLTSRGLERMVGTPFPAHLTKSSKKFAKAGATFALVAGLAGAGASAMYAPDIRARNAAAHVETDPGESSTTYIPAAHR